jgi:hypothetical protein
MHEFKHPKYYKELRKRNELAQRSAVKEDLACSGSSRISNKLDQAISNEASTEATSVRPDPGLKPQAASDKPQAPSESSIKPQASSPKQQASSSKPQASSSKI